MRLRRDRIGRAVCCVGTGVNAALVAEDIKPIRRVYQVWGGSSDSGWPDCDGDFIMSRLLNSRQNTEYQFDAQGRRTCETPREYVIEFTVGVCRKPEAPEGKVICDILGSCPACKSEPEPIFEDGKSLGQSQTWSDHAWRLSQIFAAIEGNLSTTACKCYKECSGPLVKSTFDVNDVDTGEQGRWAYLRGTAVARLIG